MPTHIAEALRALSEVIGLEDVLIIAGLLGLAFVGWTVYWLTGIAVISAMVLVIGIALARPRTA